MSLYWISSSVYAVQFIGREWTPGVINTTGYVANYGNVYDPQFGLLPDTVESPVLPADYTFLVSVGGDPTDSIFPDDALHVVTGEYTSLTTISDITPAETRHGHTADTVTIIASIITPADAVHAVRGDAATVTPTAVITPRDARHLTYADSSASIGNVGGDADIAMLTPGVVMRLLAPDVVSTLLPADSMIGNIP
jgi:hypothetical protein